MHDCRSIRCLSSWVESDSGLPGHTIVSMLYA